jgi:hypothetical protein
VEQDAAGQPTGTAVYDALEIKDHHLTISDLEQQADPPPPAVGASLCEVMKHRLKTAVGKAKYKLRQQTVELVFGVIKSIMGFRQFHLRWQETVSLEWQLVCTAYHLKRLHLMGAGRPLVQVA